MPAVLCPHPTDDRIGHQSRSSVWACRANRAYASELAQAGFVTLSSGLSFAGRLPPRLACSRLSVGDHEGDMGQYARPRSTGRTALCRRGVFRHPSATRWAATTRSILLSSTRASPLSSPVAASIPTRIIWTAIFTGWTSDRYMPRLKNYALADLPFDFHDMIGRVSTTPLLHLRAFGRL